MPLMAPTRVAAGLGHAPVGGTDAEERAGRVAYKVPNTPVAHANATTTGRGLRGDAARAPEAREVMV
jgi:hypothetical protein